MPALVMVTDSAPEGHTHTWDNLCTKIDVSLQLTKSYKANINTLTRSILKKTKNKMEICFTCSVSFSGTALIMSGVLKKSMRGLFSHSGGATGAVSIPMSINKP